MTSTTATTRDQLWTALANWAPGDQVFLGTGDFGDVWLPVVVYPAPGPVLQVAPNAKPKMSSLGTGSTNVTVKGLMLLMLPTTQNGFDIEGATNVILDGCGAGQADGKTLAGTGCWIRNSKTVTVQNCDFGWLGAGIGHLNNAGLTITGNMIHDIQTDGCIGAGSTNGVFTNNHFTNFHTAGGGHPDAIQFSDSGGPCIANVVQGNAVDRGTGDQIQGIFIEDGASYTILDNRLQGTMQNGISLARTKNSEVGRNWVQGYPDQGATIIVRQQADSINVHDNAAQDIIVGLSYETMPTKVTVTNEFKITAPATGPGDVAAFNAWKGVSPVPPVPLPPAPPVVTVNPLQATVDSLKAQLTAAQAATATATASLKAVTAKISAAQAALK